MAKHRRVPREGNHRFSQVPSVNIPRSSFNRSFGVKTAFDASWLIPIFVDEAVPGDTFSVRMQAFARLATPIKPIMDNLYLDTFFFAVPYRLVWENWQRFNGEQDDPGDSTDFVIPRIADGYTVQVGDLADYMGLPVGLDTAVHNVSALPFRAYRLIYNEWFRDENIQNSAVWNKGDGPDVGDIVWQKLWRNKRHDYFTSALPWPQKGPSVPLPLGNRADIYTDRGAGGQVTVFSTAADNWQFLQPTGVSDHVAVAPTADGTFNRRLYADLTTATASSINELRQAFQIQRLLERDARGGTRYTEILRSHFGVVSDDARLQRPEYLGGGSSPIMVSPIAQTSSTDGTTPQANLSGIGTATIGGHGFNKSFTEHCIIIGMASVRADLSYQQGLERMWSRRTRYDFYWPALAHIGEQAVLSKEIYVDNSANDEGVFGYQERYAEYRYKPNMITGLMRSSAPSSIDIWHLAQHFTSRPVLNPLFIRENPPVERVIAVPTEPQFLFDGFFRVRAARPMPTYSVPGLIDHF